MENVNQTTISNGTLPKPVFHFTVFEDFFHHIPSIEKQNKPRHNVAVDVLASGRKWLIQSRDAAADLGPSDDLDEAFLVGILEKAVEKRSGVYLLGDLALLALKGPVPKDVTDTEAKHLRYYKWVAEGRKDEDSPFASSASSSSSSFAKSAPTSHDVLPEDPKASTCGNCGTSGATQNCAGCYDVFGAGNISAGQAYCNQECQKAHWDQHKSECRELKRLQISMAQFQEIFEHLVASAYRVALAEISEENGLIRAKGRRGADERAAYLGKHIAKKFRYNLAPSRDAGKAVLMHGRGAEFVDQCKPLVDFFLKDLPHKSVEQVTFYVKNCHRSVWLEDDGSHTFSPFTPHQVLRITLACGRAVVVDASGAQFGWREVLSPWETYKRHRVHAVIGEASHQVAAAMTASRGNPTGDFAHDASAIKALMAEKLAAYLLPMVAGADTFDLQDLSPKGRAARFELVTSAKAFIDKLARVLEKSQAFKLYFAHDFRIQATSGNPFEYDGLKDTWFTPAEYSKYKRRPKKMKAEWVVRLEIMEESLARWAGRGRDLNRLPEWQKYLHLLRTRLLA
ncbi:hypothetical protein B0T26DRAFT_669656 [Lasiosphaeria miniovina]|uniref:MYND-type domain-containing protein n=1 Tax=Lasiosphaeria miniovina TaxID=1954250 RepID=A0AA40E9F1_9PEZI|nr:uncharacterized protein B0T26DRAFT_669656 [Lasiosphaeria miniovina]KAK0733234.1 hypothetical protein B0T26DRAFT_669656 [Lasiosphaeria miniovina]